MNTDEFSKRLIPLCDGRPGLRGGIHVDIREPSDHQPSTNDSQPVLDFIASDETLDRYDEIISAAGWNLENYQRNPVFQNAHQYGDIMFTIGKALTTEVISGKLTQRVQFACDVNPIARVAYGLYKGKFLNAVSVGFVPIRWQNADGSLTALSGAAHHLGNQYPEGITENSPGLDRGAVPGGPTLGNASVIVDSLSPSDGERVGVRGSGASKFRRRYLEQELLEVSAVAIPANPNALALGLKSGAVEKSDLRDLADLIYYTLDHPRPALVAPTCRAEASERRRELPGEGGSAISPSPLSANQKIVIHEIPIPNRDPPPTINHNLLLQTARHLHEILKHT